MDSKITDSKTIDWLNACIRFGFMLLFVIIVWNVTGCQLQAFALALHVNGKEAQFMSVRFVLGWCIFFASILGYYYKIHQKYRLCFIYNYVAGMAILWNLWSDALKFINMHQSAYFEHSIQYVHGWDLAKLFLEFLWFGIYHLATFWRYSKIMTFVCKMFGFLTIGTILLIAIENNKLRQLGSMLQQWVKRFK